MYSITDDRLSPATNLRATLRVQNGGGTVTVNGEPTGQLPTMNGTDKHSQHPAGSPTEPTLKRDSRQDSFRVAGAHNHNHNLASADIRECLYEQASTNVSARTYVVMRGQTL